MMISVTSLATYLYCSRKLFLQKVLGLVDIPKEALVEGAVRHDVYDRINKVEEEIVKTIKANVDLNEIKSLYKSHYKDIINISIKNNEKNIKKLNINSAELFDRIWIFLIDEISMRANNIFSFVKKYNVYGDDLWEKLTPKIKSEYRISSKTLNLTGIIDQIEIYPGYCVPVELKTGKTPKEGIWPSHRIQLASYMLMLEEELNMPIKEGFIRYLDSKEKRKIIINEFIKKEVDGLIFKVEVLLKSKDIPDFCPNSNKCAACGLKRDCHNEDKLMKLLKKLPLEKGENILKGKNLNIT